jgi:hypothetical protein
MRSTPARALDGGIVAAFAGRARAAARQMRTNMGHLSRAGLRALPVIAAIALGGCTTGPSGTPASAGAASPPAAAASAAAPGTTPSAARLSSPAQLFLVSPTANQVVHGTTLHVVVALSGATIVAATTTAVRPDQGHVHLYVDNNLVSMNYGTTQDLEVAPGTHILHAEFVASDHYPFDPRVVTPDVVFTVQP